MRKEMFSENGNWYKGNLHSHTTNSDGRLRPEEAAAFYKNYGYHFVCFSEHDYYTDLREQFDCEDFILLPGVEASVVLMDRDRTHVIKTHHIHGILGNEAMQKAAEAYNNYSGLRDGMAGSVKFIYKTRGAADSAGLFRAVGRT